MFETNGKFLTKTVDNLHHKGRSWAKRALDSSAHSLEATASFLTGLSARLDQPAAKDTDDSNAG